MNSRIKTLLPIAALGTLALLVSPRAQEKEAAKKSEVKPLRALMVTGGCCHDYDKLSDEGKPKPGYAAAKAAAK